MRNIRISIVAPEISNHLLGGSNGKQIEEPDDWLFNIMDDNRTRDWN